MMMMSDMMIQTPGAQQSSMIDTADPYNWINEFPQPNVIPSGELTMSFDEAEFFDFDEIFKNWGPQENNDEQGLTTGSGGGEPLMINLDDGVVIPERDFVDVEELFKECENDPCKMIDGGRQETNVIIIDDEMSSSNIINTNNNIQEEGLMIQVHNDGLLEIIHDNNGNLHNDQTKTNILPMGYRFKPKDVELIYCLSMKVNNEPLPTDQIHDDVNLYEFDAPNLMENFGDNGDGEWYFVTRLKMKNKGHTNRDRTTPNGCWKATSGDHEIKHAGMKVGYRKTLVYYSGKRSKTDWIMHEYRLQDDDAMVICRIHYGKREQNKSNKRARHV